MDEGRGLQRLSRLLLRQFGGRQLAELFTNEGQELRGGLCIALVDGGEDARDVSHASEDSWRASRMPGDLDGRQECLLHVRRRLCLRRGEWCGRPGGRWPGRA